MLTVKIESIYGCALKSKVSLLDEFKQALDYWVMPTAIAKNIANGAWHDWYSRRIEAAMQKYSARVKI